MGNEPIDDAQDERDHRDGADDVDVAVEVDGVEGADADVADVEGFAFTARQPPGSPSPASTAYLGGIFGLDGLRGPTAAPPATDPAARGGWDGNSNEPLLHDDTDDDVEGFGFSIGLPVDALKPDGPPIRGVLDGITLPSLGAMTSQMPRRDPLGLAGYSANANEPIVGDRDR